MYTYIFRYGNLVLAVYVEPRLRNSPVKMFFDISMYFNKLNV